MSIKLNFKKTKPDAEIKQPNVQFIPAKIDFNGTASVDKYFNNFTEDDNGVLTNALRGHPLKGCKLPIPDGYKGVIFQETDRSIDVSAERTFNQTDEFHQFTYWNYDRLPSGNDVYRMAMDWIDVSEELHKPVTQTDIDELLKSKETKRKLAEVKEET